MSCADGCSPGPIRQTVNSELLYVINWPNWGLPVDTTITESTFSTSSSDITISETSIITGGTQVAFELSGGVVPPGQQSSFYQITNSITLSDGERVDVTIPFECLAQNII